MELAEAIRNRRSVRSFKDAPVSAEAVTAIVEAGRAAPSAGNLQARDFFVIENHAVLERLVAAAPRQTFMAQAPTAVVVCVNYERITRYGQRGAELYCLQDSAAATQNMLLTAHSLGLAACWIGAFDEAVAAEVLALPKHLRPVAIVPIGWPNEQPAARPKRDDDVHPVR